MFKLPPEGHKARELMGDMCALIEMLDPKNAHKLEPVYRLRSKAFAMFADDTTGAMRRIAMITMRYDTGERWLVTFGRKGGWKKEWNFGTGRAAA